MAKYFDEQGKEVQIPEPTNDRVVIKTDDGEKVFTADDVQGLISKQADATQKAQAAAAVLNAADQLGIEPEQLLARSQAAFTVLNDLAEQGIIDDEGRPVVKKTPTPPAGDDDGSSSNDDKTLVDRVTKVVSAALAPINERLEAHGKDMTQMQRVILQDKILQKYPDLDGDDIMRVFGAAKTNPQKTVLQHAEDLSNRKKGAVEEMERKFAEKHGIDLEKYNENRLNEQGDEGGAAAMFKGKKFSFRPKKGEDAVSPLDATREFFNKNI